MTARTWGLPEEPEVGTKVRDRLGVVWRLRPDGRWEADSGDVLSTTWSDLVSTEGPLTEVPAPALPTEDGALIIASGTGFEALFENRILMRVGDYWCGLIPGAVRPTTIVQDQITSWTEAVAVPKDKLDALREALNNGSGQAIDAAAEALLETVDGRQA